MANNYGVANPQPNPFTLAGLTGGADIVTVAGTETQLMTHTFAQPDASGIWYGVIFFYLTLSLGATPPGVVAIDNRINGGADINQVNVASQSLVANAQLILNGVLVTNPSGSVWQGAGAALQLTVTASAQPITVRTGGSGAVFFLWRALDQ